MGTDFTRSAPLSRIQRPNRARRGHWHATAFLLCRGYEPVPPHTPTNPALTRLWNPDQPRRLLTPSEDQLRAPFALQGQTPPKKIHFSECGKGPSKWCPRATDMVSWHPPCYARVRLHERGDGAAFSGAAGGATARLCQRLRNFARRLHRRKLHPARGPTYVPSTGMRQISPRTVMAHIARAARFAKATMTSRLAREQRVDARIRCVGVMLVAPDQRRHAGDHPCRTSGQAKNARPRRSETGLDEALAVEVRGVRSTDIRR